MPGARNEKPPPAGRRERVGTTRLARELRLYRLGVSPRSRTRSICARVVMVRTFYASRRRWVK
jgi:hypothetical protein